MEIAENNFSNLMVMQQNQVLDSLATITGPTQEQIEN